jgi:hypothetical protein
MLDMWMTREDEVGGSNQRKSTVRSCYTAISASKILQCYNARWPQGFSAMKLINIESTSLILFIRRCRRTDHQSRFQGFGESFSSLADRRAWGIDQLRYCSSSGRNLINQQIGFGKDVFPVAVQSAAFSQCNIVRQQPRKHLQVKSKVRLADIDERFTKQRRG